MIRCIKSQGGKVRHKVLRRLITQVPRVGMLTMDVVRASPLTLNLANPAFHFFEQQRRELRQQTTRVTDSQLCCLQAKHLEFRFSTQGLYNERSISSKKSAKLSDSHGRGKKLSFESQKATGKSSPLLLIQKLSRITLVFRLVLF